jgi:hypothetical protein
MSFAVGSTGDDRIHEANHGVRLVTSRSVPITLTWLMEGDSEALVAVEGSGEDIGITDLIEARDVSASPRWRLRRRPGGGASRDIGLPTGQRVGALRST